MWQNGIDSVLPVSTFVDTLLLEGVFDQGILKAIFMAGGAGSGKSAVAADLFDIPDSNDVRYVSFSSGGLKLVNPDRAFVHGLIKAGYDPKKLADIPDEEFDRVIGGDHPGPGTIRAIAKQLAVKVYDMNKDGRLGMLIDGTGGNLPKIQGQKEDLESIGYDTYMVFVNTRLEVALARNKKRSRVVKDEVVISTWHEVQANLETYRSMFGSHFTIIENSADQRNITAAANSAVRGFMSQPVQNPIGQEWIQNMTKIRQRAEK